jgi:hypothetical protein
MYNHFSTHDMHPWIAGTFEDGNEATEPNHCGDTCGSSVFVRHHDVVCGREKLCYSHPGNRAFRDLVRARSRRYKEATRRNDKTDIAQEIAWEVERRGGRFLQRSSDVGGGGGWVPVDPDKVHDKISHALRIAIKSSSKQRSRLAKRKGGRSKSSADDEHEDFTSDEALEPLDCDNGELLEPLDYNTQSVFDLAFSETAIL